MAPLGVGGMGEVWKARDTKLGREVAIKVLPEAFAADTERLARFRREAQVLAALNHPHIAAIYGLEESRGVEGLVMELVPGETLAERLAGGPLPVEEALEVARQLAEALEAAHEKGIVHRDLKPANVKLTPEGKVKVLDFGLAKALTGDASSPDVSHSPTLTAAATQAGVVIGTAAYMSPEQARGKSVDKRTDIWAFGVVVFEMLTGQRLFSGETVSDTLAAVLTRDIDWAKLPAATPARLRRLLERCLERDAKQRLRDIGEARVALGEALQGGADERADGAATPAMPRRRALWWAGSLLLTAAVAGWTAWGLKPGAPEPPVRKFELPVVPSLTGVTSIDTFNGPVISPDGTRVAFTRDGRLWVRSLDSQELKPLPSTELADQPFWSPDSQQVGYFKNASVEVGTLWISSVQGGPSRQISAIPGAVVYGATWTPSDEIVLALAGQSRWDKGTLWAVPARGGSLKKWTGPARGGEGLIYPHVLPDGKSLLAVATTTEGVGALVLLGSGGETTLVRHPGEVLASPAYSRSGHILYQRGLPVSKGIWAVPFDAARRKVLGEPFLVAADGALPSVAADETLLYLRITGESRQQLVWVDRGGRVGEAIGQPQEWIRVPHLSPDASRVAVAGEEAGNVDIWVHDVRRALKTRLTADPAFDFDPAWSPDGERLAFSSSRSGGADIFVMPADGSGEPRPLVTGPHEKWLANWSRDGKVLSYIVLDPETGPDSLYVSPPAPNSEPKAFLRTPGVESTAVLSADGSLAAFYAANSMLEAGNVYLARFPSGEGRVQMSVNGTSSGPVWSPRGDELFYVESNRLMAVAIERQPALRVGAPRPLFSGEAVNARLSDPYNYRRRFDVAADGKRFVVIRTLSEKAYAVSVVQNWARPFRGSK
ncbi:MAG: protein kinase domain-containing protein [Thermoanaerobaculia bacterium]